ncbi:MAG: DNA double-strand break repair protein Mre11 [uncultured Nocardioidaceae bacterium]|uniref:DNA double-strand break repair protein Mre11 n=1 Tax=uncultured Nocardioidaceae bacterium TaxID=253824 RepID=A0A6J4M4W2_9ACTN|nr:MAG: DNA double-strand break repair protein Mre11 [uncultured Nocardioidaceae bacterium]
MRFVATADWQLGMTAHFLPPDARARFHQARFDAIRAIGRVASERGASFVLVCGDVFESNHLDRAVLSRAFEALRDVSVPVWLLPGNHDPLDAASIFDSDQFRDMCPEHVHVLRTPGTHQVLPGVEVVAAPWSSKRPVTDLVADACGSLRRCDDVLRVVAGHGATDAFGFDSDNPATIRLAALRKAIDDGCVQVAILGDRHSTTRLARDVWYPGAPEVTDRRETDPGNVLVVDVEQSGVVHVETVHTGQWRFLRTHRHLGSGADVDLLREWLAAQPAKERTAVWLSLEGTLSLTESAALDAALADASDLYAHVVVWSPSTDLHVLPDDEDMTQLGLTGFAAQTLTDLCAALGACAEVPPSADTAEPADGGAGSDGAASAGLAIPLPRAALGRAERELDDPDVAQAALGLLYRLAGGSR